MKMLIRPILEISFCFSSAFSPELAAKQAKLECFVNEQRKARASALCHTYCRVSCISTNSKLSPASPPCGGSCNERKVVQTCTNDHLSSFLADRCIDSRQGWKNKEGARVRFPLFLLVLDHSACYCELFYCLRRV